MSNKITILRKDITGRTKTPREELGSEQYPLLTTLLRLEKDDVEYIGECFENIQSNESLIVTLMMPNNPIVKSVEKANRTSTSQVTKDRMNRIKEDFAEFVGIFQNNKPIIIDEYYVELNKHIEGNNATLSYKTIAKLGNELRNSLDNEVFIVVRDTKLPIETQNMKIITIPHQYIAVIQQRYGKNVFNKEMLEIILKRIEQFNKTHEMLDTQDECDKCFYQGILNKREDILLSIISKDKDKLNLINALEILVEEIKLDDTLGVLIEIERNSKDMFDYRIEPIVKEKSFNEHYVYGVKEVNEIINTLKNMENKNNSAELEW